MAAQDDGDGLSSTFPDAPGYLWRDFTAENVERIDELRQAQAQTTGEKTTAATRLAGLPDELAHLQPPPEPQDGLYRLFGARYSVCFPSSLLRLANGARQTHKRRNPKS